MFRRLSLLLLTALAASGVLTAVSAATSGPQPLIVGGRPASEPYPLFAKLNSVPAHRSFIEQHTGPLA